MKKCADTLSSTIPEGTLIYINVNIHIGMIQLPS